MSIKQAAERWGVCEHTIQRAIAAKKIVAFRIGRQWRIPVAENEQVMRNA